MASPSEEVFVDGELSWFRSHEVSFVAGFLNVRAALFLEEIIEHWNLVEAYGNRECKQGFLTCSISHSAMLRQDVVKKLIRHSGLILSVAMTNIGRPVERFFPATFYTTLNALGEYDEVNEGTRKVALAKKLGKRSSDLGLTGVGDDNDHIENEKMNLASSLASLVQESDNVLEQNSKSKTRLEVRRFLVMRIKNKVKEQYTNGKFHDLLAKVIADPNSLKDAYDCIKVTSNVDLIVDGGDLSFESVAKDLIHGNFDVEANTYSISTRGSKVKKEELVFSKLKLRVVQEAIRIVLEVVYRPHFSKISHGFRSGRCHLSALKYISKGIPCPDWWFTVPINKKVDDCILTKLLSSMEEKIEDPRLFTIIRSMFDARVLNMEFGAFPKGHGLPQEGVLSPILMNIYLDLLDREIYRMSMRYEAFDSNHGEDHASRTKLRGWFRRQMNGNHVQQKNVVENSGVRVHCCRFMDEIFFAISGPKEVATAFKSDIEKYLKNSLYLEVDNQNEFLASSDPRGVKFLGTLIKRDLKETSAVRAVHKLKEKVRLFAEQKQESWDMGTIRIGKKWLGHGLKKVKESEIKHLADGTSILSQISSHRKSGMKTDHWFKVLLKIWIQDANVRNAENEEIILAKHIVEPALPKELRDSYHEFQERAKEYISMETASTLALLSGSSSSNSVFITKTLAPTNFIWKRLFRYGVTTRDGYARTCHLLIVLDDDQIIDWFSGIIRRWLRWYKECDNYNEVKLMISNEIRLSCIRTLAAKYRIHEAEIEKKFDSALSRIPSTQEIELEEANNELASQVSTLDGALTYGINYSGLCMVSLARMVSTSRPCNCFVIGCSAAVSRIYRLHVMERQKFPGWKTGFSSSIHPALNRRKLGLCKQHLKDLFLGDISLQAIDFGAWR